MGGGGMMMGYLYHNVNYTKEYVIMRIYRMRLKKEREARIAAEHNQRILEQKLMVIEQEQQASKKGN